jgi:hypothetical protein
MVAVMGLALRACQAAQAVGVHRLLPLVGREQPVKVLMAAQHLMLTELLAAAV